MRKLRRWFSRPVSTARSLEVVDPRDPLYRFPMPVPPLRQRLQRLVAAPLARAFLPVARFLPSIRRSLAFLREVDPGAEFTITAKDGRWIIGSTLPDPERDPAMIAARTALAGGEFGLAPESQRSAAIDAVILRDAAYLDKTREAAKALATLEPPPAALPAPAPDLHPHEQAEVDAIRTVHRENDTYAPEFRNRWNEFDDHALVTGKSSSGAIENGFKRTPFDFKNHLPADCQIQGYCEVCARALPDFSPKKRAMIDSLVEFSGAALASDLPPMFPTEWIEKARRSPLRIVRVDPQAFQHDLGIAMLGEIDVDRPNRRRVLRLITFHCRCTVTFGRKSKSASWEKRDHYRCRIHRKTD